MEPTPSPGLMKEELIINQNWGEKTQLLDLPIYSLADGFIINENSWARALTQYRCRGCFH